MNEWLKCKYLSIYFCQIHVIFTNICVNINNFTPLHLVALRAPMELRFSSTNYFRGGFGQPGCWKPHALLCVSDNLFPLKHVPCSHAWWKSMSNIIKVSLKPTAHCHFIESDLRAYFMVAHWPDYKNGEAWQKYIQCPKDFSIEIETN